MQLAERGESKRMQIIGTAQDDSPDTFSAARTGWNTQEGSERSVL